MIFYTEDLRKIIVRTLQQITEGGISYNNPRYGFLTNDYLVAYTFPSENLKKRFLILYNIDDPNPLTQVPVDYNTRFSTLLTLQVIDYGKKDLTNNSVEQSDGTYFIIELLNQIRDTSFLMSGQSQLATEGKVTGKLAVHKVEKLQSKGSYNQNNAWINTIFFNLTLQQTTL